MKYVEKLDGLFFLHWESLWPGVAIQFPHGSIISTYSEYCVFFKVLMSQLLTPAGKTRRDGVCRERRCRTDDKPIYLNGTCVAAAVSNCPDYQRVYHNIRCIAEYLQYLLSTISTRARNEPSPRSKSYNHGEGPY